MPGKYYTRARFALLFVSISILLAVRKPDLFTNPQLFAEDASIFFRDQLVRPAIAVLLPYNGQFHLVPRLIAVAEAVFPLSAAPIVCSVASILIHALCISIFFLPWNRWLIENDLLRAAACLVMATSLDGGEMIGFSGPLMWYLFLAGILLLFRPQDKAPEKPRTPWISMAGMVAIGASSGPMLALTPVAFWLAVKRRGPQRLIALTLLAMLVGQTVGIVFSKRSDHPAQADTFGLLAWHLATATVVTWAYPGVITPLAGKNAAFDMSRVPEIGPPLFIIITLTALVTWLLTVSPRPERKRLAIGLYLALGTLAAALYARNLVGFSLGLTGNAPAVPARYAVLPGALLAYMACLIIQKLPLRDPRLQAACLLLIFAWGIQANFHAPAYADYPWKAAVPKINEWRSARAEGKPSRMGIPIAPPTWHIDLP